MGKRKRRDDELVEKVLKKVKKLVKRRRLSSSSSNSSMMPLAEEATNNGLASPTFPIEDIVITDEIPPIEIPETSEDLCPDILELLGSDPLQDKTFGDNIHKDLAARWANILSNGLPKEEKKTILKEYLPAENCPLMRAPKLNPEIKSALTEMNVKKDSYLELKHHQLSSCISAIGKALNLALVTSGLPQHFIKTLSDAGRLLCDTHYRETLSRRFNIIDKLNKQKQEVLKKTKPDEHLFGSDLAEQLKVATAISKSASELTPRYASQASSSRYPPPSLNARGTPRQPAEPRANPGPYARRMQPPPPPSQPQRSYRRSGQPPPPSTNKARPSSYHRQQNRRR